MKCKINEISIFQKGYAFKSKDYKTEGIRIVRVTNLNKEDYSDSNSLFIEENRYDEFARYGLVKGDIIISTVGSWPTNPLSVVGKVTIIPEHAHGSLLNQNAVRLRTNDKCLQEYLSYILLDDKFKNYIVSKAQGSASQASITLNDIGNYEIDLPPILIQKKVVSILKDIDEKIYLNYKLNIIIEKQIQTIYKSWFVDFEPFGGVKPDDWVDASIVENRFSTVIKPGVNRFTKKKYLATANVNDLDYSNPKIVDYETRETRANMQPRSLSVWFAKMKNSVKHLLVLPCCKDLIENFILSTGFFGIQCEEKSFEYIASYVRVSKFEAEKDFRAHGTTQEAVNTDDLKKIIMLEPTDDVLEKYHNLTKEMFEMIIKNKEEIIKLQTLKKLLIPKLLNGEIDLENIEL